MELGQERRFHSNMIELFVSFALVRSKRGRKLTLNWKMMLESVV
jgi:hypothetical protein